MGTRILRSSVLTRLPSPAFVKVPSMSRTTWIIASILSMAAIVGFLIFSNWQKNTDLEKAGIELEQSHATNALQTTELAALREEMASSKARIEELKRENEKASQA